VRRRSVLRERPSGDAVMRALNDVVPRSHRDGRRDSTGNLTIEVERTWPP